MFNTIFLHMRNKHSKFKEMRWNQIVRDFFLVSCISFSDSGDLRNYIHMKTLIKEIKEKGKRNQLVINNEKLFDL